MHDLKEIQDHLSDFFFNKNQGKIANKLIDSDAIDRSTRLDVHRQTIIENLVNSLRIIYPGIWKLVGEKCAKGIAKSYIHENDNLPKNGSMLDLGHNFAEYLAQFPSVKHLRYLPDYAKMEWAHYQAYHARLAGNVSFEDLANYDEDSLNDAIFYFNHSVHFISSRFNLENIREVAENPDADSISLAETRSYYVLFQKAGRVSMIALAVNDWLFLSALYAGKKFGITANEFVKDSSFDLACTIQLMIANNLVQEIKL